MCSFSTLESRFIDKLTLSFQINCFYSLICLAGLLWRSIELVLGTIKFSICISISVFETFKRKIKYNNKICNEMKSFIVYLFFIVAICYSSIAFPQNDEVPVTQDKEVKENSQTESTPGTRGNGMSGFSFGNSFNIIILV